MQPIFVNDYEKREWLGREALKDLQTLNNDFFKYKLNFTTGQYDDYDAFYFIYDTDNKFKKYVWIEIKVRDKTFPDYVLEKEKLDRMIKQRERLYLKKEEVVFLYINFCPEGTYCWNITDMDDDKWDRMEMNKSTSNNRIEKENKLINLEKMRLEKG